MTRMIIGRRDPDPAAYPELSHLLAAAAAPPRPGELAGLAAAVAAFEQAGLEDETRVVRVRVRRRPVAGKAVAAAAAVVVFGGSAVAAETGRLPRGAQQQAHRAFAVLGVPPPAGGRRAGGPPVAAGSPGPSASATPAVTSAAAPAPGLCKVWRKKPDKPPRRLVALAGGVERVAAYCQRVLGQDQGQPDQGRPDQGKPGKGSGKGRKPHPKKTHAHP